MCFKKQGEGGHSLPWWNRGDFGDVVRKEEAVHCVGSASGSEFEKLRRESLDWGDDTKQHPLPRQRNTGRTLLQMSHETQ